MFYILLSLLLAPNVYVFDAPLMSQFGSSYTSTVEMRNELQFEIVKLILDSGRTGATMNSLFLRS